MLFSYFSATNVGDKFAGWPFCPPTVVAEKRGTKKSCLSFAFNIQSLSDLNDFCDIDLWFIDIDTDLSVCQDNNKMENYPRSTLGILLYGCCVYVCS